MTASAPAARWGTVTSARLAADDGSLANSARHPACPRTSASGRDAARNGCSARANLAPSARTREAPCSPAGVSARAALSRGACTSEHPHTSATPAIVRAILLERAAGPGPSLGIRRDVLRTWHLGVARDKAAFAGIRPACLPRSLPAVDRPSTSYVAAARFSGLPSDQHVAAFWTTGSPPPPGPRCPSGKATCLDRRSSESRASSGASLASAPRWHCTSGHSSGRNRRRYGKNRPRRCSRRRPLSTRRRCRSCR
jgi:hypothetical protein